MTDPNAVPRFRRRFVAGGAAALCALLLVSVADAQSADDLLRKLKPWIKQQLFGEETPEAEAKTAENPEAEPPPAASETALDASEAAGEVAPEGEAAVTPESNDERQSVEDDWPVGLVEPKAPPEAETSATGAPETLDNVPAEPVEQGPPPLRFAVLAGSSAAATIATVGPIADEIGAIVDRPVELLAMVSYAAMIDAQAELRLDGGFYSASAFALADMRCHCLEPIVAPRASDGTLAYHAVIVAKAGSDIESAFDLEGKTVAIGGADSVGARRMQLAGLMASGMDPASLFGGVLEVGSANDAVRLVRDGVVDAAFAWSSLSGDARNGYSRGTLTQLVANGELAMDDFVVVWRSLPITHGPFAVLKTLSEEEKDKMGAFFVALEATRPAAYEALNPFYGGGYAPVDPEDYGGLETLTAQNVDALRLPKVEAEIPVPVGTAPGEDE
jgi:phosphate/phosphite/phosphonate ABC transporter binding protein